MKSISEIKELLALSKNPSNIPPDLMAFFLYLKEVSREKKKGGDFNAFAMDSNELSWLGELVERMIIDGHKNLRFQIAISKWDGSEELNHWSFLEFNLNFKETEDLPTLDILICDPLGFTQSLVLANLLSTRMVFGSLSKICTLKVYIPTDTLQIKGRVCAYFATDSISMLSNQDDYCPIYDYMNLNQQEEKKLGAIDMFNQFREAFAGYYSEVALDNIYNFNIVVGPLPVRLLRTKQSVSDLEKEVRDSDVLRETVVNNKGETAWTSVNKNLLFVQDRTGSEEQRNIRVNKKMEKLEESVSEASSSVSSLEDAQMISEGIHRHRLSGLEEVIAQSVERTRYTYS